MAKKKEISFSSLKLLGKKFINTEDKEDKAPYVIPLKHMDLNRKLGGGFAGGKAHEISGPSQISKSYLIYEMAGTVINDMKGYVYLNDNEQSYRKRYGKKVGLVVEDESVFCLSLEPAMENVFAEMREFVEYVRSKDKKAPILLAIDSFKLLSVKLDLECADAKKDPKGYPAKRKNGMYGELMSTFVHFLEKYNATYILVNRLTKKEIETYKGGPVFTNIVSLCEDGVQYNSTQRIRGTWGKKDGSGKKIIKLLPSIGKNNETKKQIGVNATWEVIKNRELEPFTKSEMRLLYAEGTKPYSGLIEAWVNEGKLKYTDSQRKVRTKSGKETKAYGVVCLLDEKFYPISETKKDFTDFRLERLAKKLLERHPSLIDFEDSFDSSKNDVNDNTMLYDDTDDADIKTSVVKKKVKTKVKK